MADAIKKWSGAIGVALNLLLAGIIAFYIVKTKAIATDIVKQELKDHDYLPKSEFSSYQKSHQEWSEQVLKRLDERNLLIEKDFGHRLDRLERKIDSLQSKGP